jgi:hypothetical protein
MVHAIVLDWDVGFGNGIVQFEDDIAGSAGGYWFWNGWSSLLHDDFTFVGRSKYKGILLSSTNGTRCRSSSTESPPTLAHQIISNLMTPCHL